MVSDLHECLTGTDGLYNPLLVGTVNDTKDLAASAVDLEPGMGLGLPLDSGNDFGVVCSESAFASTVFNSCGFPHISNIEDPPISLANVERLQFKNIWNASDYTEFSGLGDSNVLRV